MSRLYYCDCWNGKHGDKRKVVPLLGPFKSEQEARDNLDEATVKVLNLDPRAHFDYFFGTMSVPEDVHIEPLFRRDPDGLLEVNPLARRSGEQEREETDP